MYATMAQSAARKSHNLQVVISSLTDRSWSKNLFLLKSNYRIFKKYMKKLQAKKL